MVDINRVVKRQMYRILWNEGMMNIMWHIIGLVKCIPTLEVKAMWYGAFLW